MSESLVQLVADYLRLPEGDVMALSRMAPVSYRSYRVPKRNGGSRLIFHPSRETKALQYALMTTFLSDLPVHETATAYRKGVRSPLRKAAMRHAKFPYTVRLDIADFFPSITPPIVKQRLNASGDRFDGMIDARDDQFLEDVLFVRAGRLGLGLAIGAPSSPAVSNFVMYGADRGFDLIAKELGGEYCRYADDLYFSSCEKGACKVFADRVEGVLGKTVSPDLSLNPKKTFFMSRGTKRVFCGIVLCPGGEVSIGRSRKKYIKKLLNDFRYGDLGEELRARLQGYLAYALDCEPEFYNRLALKYGGGVVRRALTGGE